MVLKHSKIVIHEHEVTNFINFLHDSIDVLRMFLRHQDSAVPAANTKGIAGKSSRHTRPHILSHSTVKDSAFRLILSSKSFQSQASENSPTASRDFGKRNGSTPNILFGKYPFAWESYSHFLDRANICHKEPCRVDANKKNMTRQDKSVKSACVPCIFTIHSFVML